MSKDVPSDGDAAAPIVFACGACGKSVKAQGQWAGKRVKCPHCGAVLPVPAANRPLLPWLVPALLLAVVLAATFALKLRNLDHTALTRWDESFHAVVARNVMKHPLKPTLVDEPYLAYDPKVWGENHVWLHKPILPFWQVALSFALLGVNTFALRLPAVVLSTGAAWLTYLIGKELFDRPTALIAAGLQAINPFIMTLIHGYQFADNIDVALVFWVEVAVYFLVRSLRTGAWRDLLLAGLAQGLAFLCKSYLAGIVFGLALTAWLLPILRLARREDCRIGPARLLALFGVSVLTAGPWIVFCMSEYPVEYGHEHGQVWKHLYANVENWGAPWDRLLFDYLIAIHGVFFTPAIVAGIVFLGKAALERHAGLWLVYAWSLGVIVPHLFATTKTPSATAIALPALTLLVGHLIAQAGRGDRWPLAALTGVCLMELCVPAVVKPPGYSYPQSREFGAIMMQALWVLGHLAGAFAFFDAVLLGWLVTSGLTGPIWQRARIGMRIAAQVFCLAVLTWLVILTTQAAWKVTSRNLNDPLAVEVGQFAREQLPANAVLLCDVWRDYNDKRAKLHLTAMFYADRTCYELKQRDPHRLAHAIREAGGVPFLVTRRPMPLAPVYVCRNSGVKIYRWPEP